MAHGPRGMNHVPGRAPWPGAVSHELLSINNQLIDELIVSLLFNWLNHL